MMLNDDVHDLSHQLRTHPNHDIKVRSSMIGCLSSWVTLAENDNEAYSKCFMAKCSFFILMVCGDDCRKAAECERCHWYSASRKNHLWCFHAPQRNQWPHSYFYHGQRWERPDARRILYSTISNHQYITDRCSEISKYRTGCASWHKYHEDSKRKRDTIVIAPGEIDDGAIIWSEHLMDGEHPLFYGVQWWPPIAKRVVRISSYCTVP